MDFETKFHQNRLKPKQIERTAFNKNYGQYEYLVNTISPVQRSNI